MESSLHELTFHLTGECNLACSYCCQTRQKQNLEFSSVRRALDYFQDALRPQSYIVFYGGEPLLAFETIRKTLAYIRDRPSLRGKKLNCSISTNGLLLTDEIIGFLSTHRFRVSLSHDGTAQDKTRPNRKNSLIEENLDRMIRLKRIELSTNSVFVPDTVGELFASARFLLERGVKDCSLSYSISSPWDSAALEQMRGQVKELRKFLLGHYRRHSSIPVANFRGRPARSPFWCSAGQDRLALAADGRLWGCRLFADFFSGQTKHSEFNTYCFGDIRHLNSPAPDSYSSVYSNYGLLRPDGFSSEKKACRRCPRKLYCGTCPAAAAFSTGLIGKVPDWTCEMKEIWRAEFKKFWRAAEKC